MKKQATYLDADNFGLNGPPDPREDMKRGDEVPFVPVKCHVCKGTGSRDNEICYLCEGSGEG